MDEEYISGAARMLFLLLVILAGILGWQISEVKGRVETLENICPCSISYGGQNMSVEDAFERAGEGLTADQADEVKILIEEYCDADK